MSFVDNLKAEANITYSENGGKVVSTTNSALLDLFANIGGMRNRNSNDIISMWRAARLEDKELADNLILYTRGIRNGGIGERRIGRLLLGELARIDPTKVIRNFQTIVDAGRWDDLFVFIGTPVENEMWSFIHEQFLKDIEFIAENKPISLMVKWLKSENTSSVKSRKIATLTRTHLGLTSRQYRKTLSRMRNYIDVVEKKMSSGNWEDIEYEKVPSYAMKNYKNAFNKHTPEKFEAYKAALQNGETKINSSTLYPYDLVKPYFKSYNDVDAIIEEQWKALPNYLENEDDELLFIIDSSGSMTCDDYNPISTAIGLGIYYAQKNKGAYHNLFMTFSEQPEILSIKDEWNLYQCINRIYHTKWGFSTNLDAAFGKIYQIAKESNDAPKALCIVSDMEIDNWSSAHSAKTITEKWARKFEEIGLIAPKLIYWNVASRNNHMLANSNENVSFISGAGIGPFKFFRTLISKTAYEAMEEILNNFNWK